MDPAPSPGARTLAAAERKALRRTRVELASGGRCERAERVLSDQLDGVATAAQERFLTAHLGRCRRCRSHAAELAIAAQPPPRLRLVSQLPPGREPLALEAAPTAPPALTLVTEAVTDRPPPTPTHVAVRRNRSNSALPAAIGALIAVGLITLAIVLLMHFNNGDSHAHAPWANPHAPLVHPTPITDQ